MTNDKKEQQLPQLRAVNSSGQTWDDPDDVQLFDIVADLHLHEFMIMQQLNQPNDQYYMQIYVEEIFGNRFVRYQIEYRDGSPEAHYQAQIEYNVYIFGNPVVTVLQQWIRGDESFRTSLPWEPLDL
ncbi:hypothetical protein [Shimazuella kribbensis]|uniref:hypothetical protein n=1 Tax=Shimazuella kribbensis TaxID=139808 RepID=UPI0012EC2D70|nr:hypothetical protein [Shimazuella kribbensis]